MRKNIIIVFSVCSSSLLFSQGIHDETSSKIKPDSNALSISKTRQLPDSIAKKHRVAVIQMPNAKPKDSSNYSALKGNARNDQPFKILNAVRENEKLKQK